MSLNKLSIPKVLKVGYQKRSETYTGKLAYVTQIDEKGKHRCENSWNGWRDNKIEPDDFDNEPTSGFVLNKKAGDYRGGWNGRQAWMRIYDPRGFEFEISINNLVFILEECSSIKGKGLEGEFVYSWDGKDLVLLPTSSQEYIESSKFTGLKTKKITKKEMTEGCLYLNKDNDKVMYLGRHDFIDYSWNSYKKVKKHVYKYMEEESGSYWIQPGFTKLAVKLTEDPVESYADTYEEFIKSKHYDGPSKVTKKRVKFDPKKDYTGGYRDTFEGFYFMDSYVYKISISHLGERREIEDHDKYKVKCEGRAKISNEFQLTYGQNKSEHSYNHYNREKNFLSLFKDWGEYKKEEKETSSFAWNKRIIITESLIVDKKFLKSLKLFKIYAGNKHDALCFEIS